MAGAGMNGVLSDLGRMYGAGRRALGRASKGVLRAGRKRFDAELFGRRVVVKVGVRFSANKRLVRLSCAIRPFRMPADHIADGEIPGASLIPAFSAGWTSSSARYTGPVGYKLPWSRAVHIDHAFVWDGLMLAREAGAGHGDFRRVMLRIDPRDYPAGVRETVYSEMERVYLKNLSAELNR